MLAALTGGPPASTDAADQRRVRRHLGRAASEKCGTPRPVTAWPQAGYYLEMVAVGETFHVWVTSDSATAHVRSWLAGDRSPANLGIPGAPIELDPLYNAGYSYRLKPGEVTFARAWIEVCDAAPCYVERDPGAWQANPGTWCPWAAAVTKIWDCTGGGGRSCGEPVFDASAR